MRIEQLFPNLLQNICFSHPSIRGAMLIVCNTCVVIGLFVIYLLGYITTWRKASFIGLSCPIVTMVLLFFVSKDK